MDAIGISALGDESVAHECVAPVTKNTLIDIAPNSFASTGDQGVHVASGGTKGEEQRELTSLFAAPQRI